MTSVVLRILGGLAVAVTMLGLLLFGGLFLGGAECDRGQCNWFGELIDETFPAYLVVSVAVAVTAGALAVRARMTPGGG